VLTAGPVVRVKVWNPDGLLLWSDEPRLVGLSYRLDSEARAAAFVGAVGSDITNVERPENRYERGLGPLLEVYVGVQDTTGRPLIVETYQSYDAVVAAADEAWRSFAPAGLGALLLLELVQVPFAWGMARRLRRHQRAEAELLRAAVDASQAERRRIAHDVHDGVVQDLTGITYDLDAARLGGLQDEDVPGLVARTASGLRRCVGELRRLLVDLNPPPLPAGGLGPALAALAEGLEQEGREVDVHAEGTEELPRSAAALLYRCALEARRNVSAHSGAQRVLLVLTRQRDSATLVVADDGVGFDEVRLAERSAAGHLGLRALTDLLSEAGGSLTTTSTPGRGTRLVAIVPLEPAPPEVTAILSGAHR
jgi:signal transduction histidine kinase